MISMSFSISFLLQIKQILWSRWTPVYRPVSTAKGQVPFLNLAKIERDAGGNLEEMYIGTLRSSLSNAYT